MFDIGIGEFIALAVIAILVLGPEKLPGYAADGARFLRQLRRVVNNAREDVRRELGPEMQDLNLAELNPRDLLRKHVLDPDDDDLRVDFDDGQSRRSRPTPSEAGPEAVTGPPPYDTEAT